MKNKDVINFISSPINKVTPMNRSAAGDLFGIELECEGKNIDNLMLQGWVPHADGSLRANHGSAIEWVFDGPVNYKESVKRVTNLFKSFESAKAKLVPSNRTSVHVHFNMSDKIVYQLLNVFILFSVLEGVLDRFCGEDREGNLFCLSSKYAEEQVLQLNKACFENQSFRFEQGIRYTALNLASMNKFGSIEFRGMRGVDNKDDLLNWLSILNDLCSYGCYEMKNPIDLIQDVSIKSPLGFIESIFSEDNYKLLTNNLTNYEITELIYESLRNIQMFAYKVGSHHDKVIYRGRDYWQEIGKKSAEEAPKIKNRYVDPALEEIFQVNPFNRDEFNRGAFGIEPLRVFRPAR